MPPPEPAQRERRPDDHRKTDLAGELDAVFRVVDQRRLGHVEPDPLHGVFEDEAVFRFLDRLDVRADQDHVVLFQHAAVREFDRQIQRGLPADGRQHGKTRSGRHFPLDADDLFQILERERLDISAVGRLRIGHDGGRVRVREDHFVALGLERLAGLRAGVIKLRRLPNDDGPGAEDQNFLNVSAFWHYAVLLLAPRGFVSAVPGKTLF